MNIKVYPIPIRVSKNKYFDILYTGIGKNIKSGYSIQICKSGIYGVFQSLFIKKKERIIIHIHWASKIYGSKYILKSIFLMIKNFSLLSIIKLKKNYRIVWTMHNIGGHDYPHPFIDKMGRKILFAISDIVIIQQKSYAIKFAQTKVKNINCPNFIDVYGQIAPSNEILKKKYNIKKNDIILLSLGMIRPYKKLELIIDAFNKATNSRDNNLKLIIIGTGPNEYFNELYKRTKSNVNIYLENTFIEDYKIPALFSISDFSIFHFDDSMLTSASLLLSLSYGVPVITMPCYASEVIKNNINGLIYKNDNHLIELLETLPKKITFDTQKIINSVSKYNSIDVQKRLVTIYKELFN